jgi:hypothetical protein
MLIPLIALTFRFSLFFWYMLTALNSRYRKYSESAHAACLTNPISQPSLGISPVCMPFSAVTLASYREDQYDLTNSSWVSVRFYFLGSVFIPQKKLNSRHKMVS